MPGFNLRPLTIGSLFIVTMGRLTMFLKRKYEFNLKAAWVLVPFVIVPFLASIAFAIKHCFFK